MKIFALLLLASYCVVGFAWVASGNDDPDLSAKQDVRKALEDFFESVEQRNWDVVEEMMSEDFEFYSNDLLKFNRSEFIGAMKHDEMQIDLFEMKDVEVDAPINGRLAWAKYRTRLVSKNEKSPIDIEAIETVVFRKLDNGKWVMCHNHATVKDLLKKTSDN